MVLDGCKLKITVRYYSTLRGLASEVPETHRLEPGATVRDLLTRIFALHPELGPFQSSLLVARNNEYVSPDCALAAGDLVDLMPPVSGG